MNLNKCFQEKDSVFITKPDMIGPSCGLLYTIMSNVRCLAYSFDYDTAL